MSEESWAVARPAARVRAVTCLHRSRLHWPMEHDVGPDTLRWLCGCGRVVVGAAIQVDHDVCTIAIRSRNGRCPPVLVVTIAPAGEDSLRSLAYVVRPNTLAASRWPTRSQGESLELRLIVPEQFIDCRRARSGKVRTSLGQIGAEQSAIFVRRCCESPAEFHELAQTWNYSKFAAEIPSTSYKSLSGHGVHRRGDDCSAGNAPHRCRRSVLRRWRRKATPASATCADHLLEGSSVSSSPSAGMPRHALPLPPALSSPPLNAQRRGPNLSDW